LSKPAKQTANTSLTPSDGAWRGGDPRPVPVTPARVFPSGHVVWANEPRRGMRQGKPNEASSPRAPFAECAGASDVYQMSKRLSATDISALASMKNVAKCDTWCELQNPVNHRVFERKLRPKPLGRGHVCLGVTHRVAPPPSVRTAPVGGGGGGYWPPVLLGARLAQMRSLGDSCHDKWWLNNSISRAVVPLRRPLGHPSTTQRCRCLTARTFDRDPRSGGITR
jgi:hypothetical protein